MPFHAPVIKALLACSALLGVSAWLGVCVCMCVCVCVYKAHLLCDNGSASESIWKWQTDSYKRLIKIVFDVSTMSLLIRNALNDFHKIRRHLNEPRTAKPSNSIKLVMNRPTFSASQISIQVSALHADSKGRLEISCVSTIPSKIGRGDMYADYKSYSTKSKWRHLFSLILYGDIGAVLMEKFCYLFDFQNNFSYSVVLSRPAQSLSKQHFAQFSHYPWRLKNSLIEDDGKDLF